MSSSVSSDGRQRIHRIDGERARVGVVRKARLQDAVNIFELVNSLSGDGTLLRRSYADICENVATSRWPSRRAASFWAAERCICMGLTWPRCGRLW